MRGYYDLSIKPATYDFWVWLVICKTKGVQEVVFDVSKGFQTKKFDKKTAIRMYENVLIPMCEVIGMRWGQGTEGDICPGYKHRDALDNLPLDIPRFQLSDGPPTVTIRESIRNKHRDSSQDWRVFSEEIGAVVIEDAYKVPISFEDRMKLYTNSRVNYFNSNGCGVPCLYSNIPVVFFSPESARGTWNTDEGKQFPWFNEKQKIVWENDTLKAMRREHAVYS